MTHSADKKRAAGQTGGKCCCRAAAHACPHGCSDISTRFQVQPRERLVQAQAPLGDVVRVCDVSEGARDVGDRVGQSVRQRRRDGQSYSSECETIRVRAFGGSCVGLLSRSSLLS